MPNMSDLAIAVASLKAAKDAVEAMGNLTDPAALRAKQTEFHSRLIDAGNATFAAQEERAKLLTQIRELEEEVGRLKTWENEKHRYKLDQLPPAVFVYTLQQEQANGEPLHHICKTCYERGKKSILDSDNPYNGVYHLTCRDCGAKLQIGRNNALPSSIRPRSGWQD